MFKVLIRTNKTEGQTSLCTRLKVEGKSIWVNLQLPVSIEKWNEVSGSDRKTANYLDKLGYGKKLTEIEFGVKDLRERHRLTKESLNSVIQKVVLAEVREQFQKDIELERIAKERKRKDVKSFVKMYVDGIVKGEILNTKGEKYSINSIKSWTQFRRLFLECYKNKSFTWEELDQSLIHQFLRFIKGKYAVETQNRHIGIYSTLISTAELQGLHRNGIVKKWLKSHEANDNEKKARIYLTKEELKALYEMKLTGRMEQVRDLFLIGCYTGLRYVDFSRIEKGWIGYTEMGNKVLRCIQQKTKKKVVVPILNDELEFLLQKYDYHVPYICDQIMNRYIKIICKDLADIIPSFKKKIRTILTKTESEGELAGKLHFERDSMGWVIKPRYELVACHTVRRTCITNMYLSGKYSTRQIMSVSGHDKEESLVKYLRCSLDEKADDLVSMAGSELF